MSFPESQKTCGTDTRNGNNGSLTSTSPPTENGGAATTTPLSAAVINLDHGDPTIYEPYWKKMGEKSTVVISGHDSLSYFSDVKNFCWFLEPKLEEQIKRVHRVVKNAAVDGYYIVVGTGSTQLVQASLYALSDPDQAQPVNVVAAAPYYSCYPEVTDFLQSRLYRWAGDAHTYAEEGPYIEFVTSPNNPDGTTRESVVKHGQGKQIHDLAYYWPQYTPITETAQSDIMLFTVSKCSGHAGSRLGWALVKDKATARKMIKFMEVSTIGVSKESQLRAAKILEVISDSCKHSGMDNFFAYGHLILVDRWQKLRDAIGSSEIFSLHGYPKGYCLFKGETTKSYPAFAWIKCDVDTNDGAKFLRGVNILARGGSRFGSDPKYVRVSMVSREEDFSLFVERMLTLQGTSKRIQH